MKCENFAYLSGKIFWVFHFMILFQILNLWHYSVSRKIFNEFLPFY